MPPANRKMTTKANFIILPKKWWNSISL